MTGKVLFGWGVTVLLSLCVACGPVCGPPPPCKGATISAGAYTTLGELGAALEVVAIAVEVKGAVDDVRDLSRMTDEFSEFPALGAVAEYLAVNEVERMAVDFALKRIPELKRAKASFEGLQGFDAKLKVAIASGDESEIAKIANRGVKYLKTAKKYLKLVAEGADPVLPEEASEIRGYVDRLDGVQDELSGLVSACGGRKEHKELNQKKSRCGEVRADNKRFRKKQGLSDEEWSSYSCQERAGGGCFSGKEYTKAKGTACPGALMCCD